MLNQTKSHIGVEALKADGIVLDHALFTEHFMNNQSNGAPTDFHI